MENVKVVGYIHGPLIQKDIVSPIVLETIQSLLLMETVKNVKSIQENLITRAVAQIHVKVMNL